MSFDFFKGVNKIKERTFERNNSGTDFFQGPSSPSLSPVNRSIRDPRDTNESSRVHGQHDRVTGHAPWTNHNPMLSIPEGFPKDHHSYPYHQRQVIPKEQPRSLEHPTTNYNIPNGPFLQSPQFPYNETPPRTSAHFHGCPSCACPIVVQVTADLSYHHVTLIPAATARRSEVAVNFSSTEFPVHSQQRAQEDSLAPESIRAQEYFLAPESIRAQEYLLTSDSIPRTDDDSLSNEMIAVPEKQPEMVTAIKEELKPALVETKETRSYASITAGRTINQDDNNKDKPNSEKPNSEAEAGIPNSEEETNTNENKPNPEEEVAKGDDKTTSEADNAYNINNEFTTVVSSKTKKKAKAEAKARAFAEMKRMFNKQRRGAQREERGARGEHDKRGMGGSRDRGHDKHGRLAKEHGQDVHREAPRDGHSKAPREVAGNF